MRIISSRLSAANCFALTSAEVFASPQGGWLGRGRPNTFAGRPSMDYARTHNL